MTVHNMIEKAECKYFDDISHIADRICENRHIKLILIAGPSCSGKTTTSSTLSRLLYERAKIKSYTISIDDFYKDVTFLPGETFADKDFEALDSIDLDLLHECLRDLADGKTVDIPLFDFEKTYRDGIRSTITLYENEIAIIEGLHALNPAIYEHFVSRDKICSIFLDCRDNDESHKYERFIRRLVRDRNFRNADALLTFTLWKKVVAGEQKHIYPFSHTADFSINTYHDYEKGLLKPFALKLLDEIGEDCEFYPMAQSVKEYLSFNTEIIDKKDIPKTSLLREFVG